MGEIKSYSSETRFSAHILTGQAQELHEALGEIELLDGLPGFNEAELNKARTVLEHGLSFEQVSECVKVDERVRKICNPSVQNTKVSPLKSITSQDLATFTANLKNPAKVRISWRDQPPLHLEKLCPPEREIIGVVPLINRPPRSYLSISLLVSQELSGAIAISSSVIAVICPQLKPRIEDQYLQTE